MAQQVVTRLVDDLDGTEIEDGEGETVNFALDGVSYEIDLSTENAEGLRESLAAYIDAGRRTGGRRSSGGQAKTRKAKAPDASDPKVIREWAVANGYELSTRGRIPASIVEAYEAAS